MNEDQSPLEGIFEQVGSRDCYILLSCNFVYFFNGRFVSPSMDTGTIDSPRPDCFDSGKATKISIRAILLIAIFYLFIVYTPDLVLKYLPPVRRSPVTP